MYRVCRGWNVTHLHTVWAAAQAWNVSGDLLYNICTCIIFAVKSLFWPSSLTSMIKRKSGRPELAKVELMRAIIGSSYCRVQPSRDTSHVTVQLVVRHTPRCSGEVCNIWARQTSTAWSQVTVLTTQWLEPLYISTYQVGKRARQACRVRPQ